MFGTSHLVRDIALRFVAMIVLVVAACIAIDYSAAVVVAIGGFALVGLLALPLATTMRKSTTCRSTAGAESAAIGCDCGRWPCRRRGARGRLRRDERAARRLEPHRHAGRHAGCHSAAGDRARIGLQSLSRSIDWILNYARDLVRESQAMACSSDGRIAQMTTLMGEALRHIGDAITSLESDPDAATRSAEAAIRSKRQLEHTYYTGMAELLTVEGQDRAHRASRVLSPLLADR